MVVKEEEEEEILSTFSGERSDSVDKVVVDKDKEEVKICWQRLK
jgi:hypothetical protein